MLRLKEHKEIIFLTAVFVILNAVFLHFYEDVWWDSSVYIGMGKFIYSLGNSGLWEESRPIVLPLILGFGWKLGVDELLFSRIISVLFSAASLVMVYLIGKKLFNRRIGLLSALFTSFSFTFFFFSSQALSEIPSLFFALASFYFLLEKRYLASGLLAGLCVMTRFFNFIIIFGVYLAFIFYHWKKKDFWKNCLRIAGGVLIPILLFLTINQILYSNPIYPFALQAYLTKTTGWMHSHDFWFYFAELFKENFMLVLLPATAFFYRRDFRFNAILFSAIFYVLAFSFISHKEPRFLIGILPFLYLLLSYCIFQIHSKFKKQSRIVLAILLTVWIISTFLNIKFSISNQYQRYDESFQYFREEIKNHDNIWITNPLYALHYGGKVDGILYYPESSIMNNEISGDGAVFYSSCDIPCPSVDIDPKCKGKVAKIHDALNNFQQVYSGKEGSCEYKIFIS